MLNAAAERGSWVGTASDFLRAATSLAGDDISKKSADWPKHPGALAGRLRRAQTFLRMLGIEISFSPEGRAGTRTIRISSGVENRATSVSAVSTVSTVSVVRHDISACAVRCTIPSAFPARGDRASYVSSGGGAEKETNSVIRRVSAANFMEAAVIIEASLDPVASRRFDDLIKEARIIIRPNPRLELHATPIEISAKAAVIPPS